MFSVFATEPGRSINLQLVYGTYSSLPTNYLPEEIKNFGTATGIQLNSPIIRLVRAWWPRNLELPDAKRVFVISEDRAYFLAGFLAVLYAQMSPVCLPRNPPPQNH